MQQLPVNSALWNYASANPSQELKNRCVHGFWWERHHLPELLGASASVPTG
jgi:hypothetical protein